jgi:DNA replication and repair protein RecF
MIESLELKNFKGFKTKKFKFDKEIVIIHGNNARGKSTLLEAIFLILNGFSPWGGTYENFLNYEELQDKYFTITAEIKDKRTLTLYQDKQSRSFLIDKKKVSKKKFFSFQKANLFSPEQIELLMYLPQKRRDFLDHLISDIDLEYKEYLVLYKRVLRQRNARLKKLAKIFFETNRLEKNDNQIKYWDNMLAELASKIMVKRAEIIKGLKDKEYKIEYRPSVVLNLFEDMLDQPELEKIYKKQIQENIKKDIVTGFSNIGIHRDDWSILSTKQDLKKFGSRGEKRLGIASLILQTQNIYQKNLGYYPILLLDDISAELDTENIEKIFSNKMLKKQQVFISTTKKESIPKDILKTAQAIKLA